MEWLGSKEVFVNLRTVLSVALEARPEIGCTSMIITAYIHPTRTYLPCTGAGRFINNLILGLTREKEVDLELFFSEQWLGDEQKLDARSPLRGIPNRTFPAPENRTERSWKFIGRPKMDQYLPDNIDWLFTPMETYIPVTKCPVAITIFDIQAFEPDLPWSRSWQHRWFAYKWGRWVRRALRDFRVIFTISEFSRQRMVELLGGNPDKIVVAGVGVEQPFFDIAAIDPTHLPRPVEQPYTLLIGGLRYKKGGNYVLAVAQELLQHQARLQIVVAGDSEPDFVEAAEDYPNVTLLGMVADEALPGILRAASSLLFLSPYEGFGIPAAEAMAASVPAVVSNRASLPEVVGQAGIIVEPEGAAGIADILLNLERDSHLRANYIQRGQVQAAQYTWSRSVDRVLTTLKERI